MLDVINGYLILAMKLYKNRENIQVIGILDQIIKKCNCKKLIKIFSKFIEHKAKNIVFINKKQIKKRVNF